jgi:hypothetical protein
MPAPSNTVLNTSDPNYQAMLTTEPLDTANIVDVSADLSTPFDYLTNSDTDADNADLCSAHRWAWYCKDPACPKYWSAWSSPTSSYIYTRGCAPRGCTDTYTCRMSRAGEEQSSDAHKSNLKSESFQNGKPYLSG